MNLEIFGEIGIYNIYNTFGCSIIVLELAGLSEHCNWENISPFYVKLCTKQTAKVAHYFFLTLEN